MTNYKFKHFKLYQLTLIVIILAFSYLCTPAFASSEYEEEILFRDFDWEISFSKFKENMEFYIKEESFYDFNYGWENEVVDDSYFERSNFFNNIGFIYEIECRELYVGGYPVHGVAAQFLYPFDDDLYITSYNKKDAFLIYACYVIDPTYAGDAKSSRQVAVDFTKKLTLLYGDIDYHQAYFDESNIQCNSNEWYGASSTAVRVINDYSVAIEYGFTNIDTILQVISQRNQTDIGGL